MFDDRNYYRLYNSKTAAAYAQDREKLLKIADETVGKKGVRESRNRFFKTQAQFLIACMDLEEKWNREYFTVASREQLRKDQDILYEDLKRSTYGKTVLNPSFASKTLGHEEGPYFSAVAVLLRENIQYAYKHMQFLMHQNHQLFFEFYELMEQNRKVSSEEIRQFLQTQMIRQIENREGTKLHDMYDPSERGRLELIETLDWSDQLNLYALGEYVSKNARKLQEYMQSLTDETIEKMALNLVEGYRKGFLRNGKDLLGRKIVGISYPLGMERLMQRVIPLFRSEMNYVPLIQSIDPGVMNRQYTADHRFDQAAWICDAYYEENLKVIEKALSDNEEMLGAFGGPVYIELYGEKPYTPRRKQEALHLNEEQQKLYADFRMKKKALYRKVMPDQYMSYTIVSYPSPEIGDDFAAIFDQTIEINTLDESIFEHAQQRLIDAMDQASFVHVTGTDGNETDLKIALSELKDPAHETLFFNCLADQNIPVGEVFTSPRLQGTQGQLHVKKAYLNGLPFENLKLFFQDGYVTDYSCTNFESEEENRKYIEEHILFPYQTLPMGEFAIGTNVTAFEMARRYHIEDRMQVLIWEKTGPHFAVGDTCYSHEEDLKVYNTASNKEITAKDNEKSILRKDPEQEAEAYTGIHIDVVLPFHEVGSISALREDGQRTDLILNGRFVLHGTEKLNEAFVVEEETREES